MSKSTHWVSDKVTYCAEQLKINTNTNDIRWRRRASWQLQITRLWQCKRRQLQTDQKTENKQTIKEDIKARRRRSWYKSKSWRERSRSLQRQKRVKNKAKALLRPDMWVKSAEDIQYNVKSENFEIIENFLAVWLWFFPPLPNYVLCAQIYITQCKETM